MNLKRVELVTPVHNRREITLQCLRSLTRIDRTGIDVHIIVVNDGSTDGTGDAIREQFSDVQVIEGDGNLWYTAGTVVGINAALNRDPDFILCFNDDSIFGRDTVRALVECAERNPHSVVGALLLLWDEPHRVFQVAPYWNTLCGGWQHRTQQTIHTIPNSEFPVEAIVGNCILYPREAFELFGFPDSKISEQYGDAEFTTRIRKSGWNLIVDPRARILIKPNDPSESVFLYGWRKAFHLLFMDRRHRSNLIQQFRQLWYTAPSHYKGVAAFVLFYTLLLGRKLLGKENSRREPAIAVSEVAKQ